MDVCTKWSHQVIRHRGEDHHWHERDFTIFKRLRFFYEIFCSICHNLYLWLLQYWILWPMWPKLALQIYQRDRQQHGSTIILSMLFSIKGRFGIKENYNSAFILPRCKCSSHYNQPYYRHTEESTPSAWGNFYYIFMYFDYLRDIRET